MADSDGKDKRGRGQKIGDGFSNFAKFLFNKETGQVMGRTGKSWSKILAFYLVFYGFLAGFFAAMLTVFLTTLNEPGEGSEGAPKLIQFLEGKPGLTIAVGLNLKYQTYEEKKKKLAIENYVNATTALLKKYNTADQLCDPANITGTSEGKSCRYDTSLLGECATASAVNTTTYGLEEGSPCLYIRINKIFGWVPKGLDSDPQYLLLKCGEGVEVMPKGFLIAAFPFRGQKDFELPVVAVKFKDLSIKKNVDCYLSGKGIELSESYTSYRAYSKIRIS